MKRLLFILALVVGHCGPPALPLLAQAPPVPAEADLRMPVWTYCRDAAGAQLACFTQDDVRQLLRLQEQAQYGQTLQRLDLELTGRQEALRATLESIVTEYRALVGVTQARNVALEASLATATAQTERWRSRAERRRIWPWVAMGLGVVVGGILGYEVHR